MARILERSRNIGGQEFRICGLENTVEQGAETELDPDFASLVVTIPRALQPCREM